MNFLQLSPLNNINRLLSESIDCSQFTSCFSCNGHKIGKFPCIWKGSECTTNNNQTLDNSYWMFQLNKCTDSESITLMDKYCGRLEGNNKDEMILENSKLYGNKSISNLFCKWDYKQNYKNYSIVIEFHKKTKCYLSLIINEKSTQTVQKIIIEDKFAKKFSSNETTFTIYYFSQVRQTIQPFEFSIEPSYYDWTSNIILYILISAGIFIIIISSILFVCCFFKIFSNKIPIHEIVSISSTSSTPRKLFSLEELNLQKIMVNESKNQKCPICIDDFKKGDEIVIPLCKHGFHYKCIEQWIMKNPKMNIHCPLCNYDFKNGEKGKSINYLDDVLSGKSSE